MVGGERRTARLRGLRVDDLVFRLVTATTYLLMAVAGLGYLALTWSTVLLFGGFVNVLQKKDFWALTIISMIQALRIFNDLAERLIHYLLDMLAGSIINVARNLLRELCTWSLELEFIFLIGTLIVAFEIMCRVTAFLYRFVGPVTCITLALWRIAQRDYGEDASDGNLMPALDIFYSLVLLQGGFYVVSGLLNCCLMVVVRAYHQQLHLPEEEWCRSFLARYLSDTRARCWREPASIRGRTLCNFAVDSLDSGTWDDMVSGVRMLDAFVSKNIDLRPQFLAFRTRIQTLIDALGWRQLDGASTEIREPAARIVANLASEIRLAQFPGAIDSISSLLLQVETTRIRKKQDNGSSNRGGPNELVLQGLTILEGLASDNDNCRVICGAPGLLRKIMAPLSSADLIQDISNRDWANVVNRSFKVLYRLISAPGETSSRLCREISSNNQSTSNLESILEHGHGHDGMLDVEVELQMGAMGILSRLALDGSIDLAKETKENLIKKQLHIFLADGGQEGGDKAAAVLNTLREWAGRTLLWHSNENTALTMAAQNDIIGRLAEILDANNTITCRTIAAYILENVCAHCDLDKQWVKETLLPKVLREILSSKQGRPANGVSLPNPNENQQISATGNDKENQNISTEDQNKSSDGAGGNEEQTTTGKLILQEAFLSLALVIRDKLVSADDFHDAVQKNDVGPGEIVAHIKTIVKDNCKEAAGSLRIVKLGWRMVEPMMEREQYAQHFKNKEFVMSLCNASETMSNTESCMLFAGTDFKVQTKQDHDIEERALNLLGQD